MSRDLRLAWNVLLPLFLIAEALGATGIAGAPHEQILALLKAPERMLMAGFLLAHIHFLHAMSRPGWREYAITAAAGCALFGAYLLLDPATAGRATRELAVLFGGCLGMATLGTLGLRAFAMAGAGKAHARELLNFSLLFYLFGCVGSFYLELTSALHPATFDAIAFRIDATLGFQPSTLAALLSAASPLIAGATTIAYGALFLGFIALYAMQATERRVFPVSIVVAFLTSAIFACLVYHLCPIAGPKFLFADKYPNALPDLQRIAPEIGVVWPTARNGLPSFHLAWALFLWMNACHAGRLARGIFALLAGLTALATLSLGEHYLVDLAAGVPTAIAMQAAYSRVLPWNLAQRRNALLGGALLVVFWIVAVRYGVHLFLAVPGLAWAAIAATLVASAAIYRPLAHANAQALRLGNQPRERPVASFPIGSRREAAYAGAVLALWGLASLMFQLPFARMMTQTFGSSSTAGFTVLATYMGGVALGAWLGGRLAAARVDALRLFAYCELAIGAYCLAAPWIIESIQALYAMLATGAPPDAVALTFIRVLLGAAVLGIPAVLTGMALPILARFFGTRTASLGVAVALLYSTNAFGAALGVLLTGFLLLPALGVLKTTLCAALLNGLIAVLALRYPPRPHVPGDPGGMADDPVSPRLAFFSLAILTVGGMVTSALGVTYLHLLTAVAGSSVYAISSMLFGCFAGLGAGAQLARWLLRSGTALALSLAWLEFALSAVILCGVHWWTDISEYFAYFTYYPLAREFGARELVRGLVCLVATMPPAVLVGALVPLAIEAFARARNGSPIALLGRAAALNIAGGIGGVLAAAFVLLPAIAALRATQLLALLCLLLGLISLSVAPMRRRAIAWLPAAAVMALFAFQPASLDDTALTSGANVYFAPQTYGNIEGRASDSGAMAAQVGLALVPLLHSPNRERALVIGFGTGIPAPTLHAASFLNLDVVDRSADGRNFLLLQDRAYDLVSVGAAPIWSMGTASLYNREFYQLARRRLRPDGVLQQRMQLHHLEPTDLFLILGTVRAEFERVWLYRIGDEGIIVASNDPRAGPAAAESNPAWLLDPAATDRLLAASGRPAAYWISTDDNLRLEYSTPRGNVLDGRKSLDRNLELLLTARCVPQPAQR